METKFITERLLLNLLTEGDHDFIQDLVNTKGWLQFIGDRNIHSKEAAISYINKINGTPDCYYWIVRLKENYRPVGVVTFMKRHYLTHADIGFALLPEYNGKGYAYEAANAVLSFIKLQQSIVLATTLATNVRSIGLLVKLGFHFDHEMVIGNNQLCVYSTES